MASSTISGVGSGVDTQSIVKALVAAEKAPKQAQITAQQTNTTIQLSSLGTVKSALEAYRTAIDKLKDPSSFSGMAGSSSDDKKSKVTIDATASTGKYDLVVEQLATASKVSSPVYTDGASSIVNTTDEATTLTISQSGVDYNVNVPGGATLKEMREAINTQLGSKGISANVLTDASGSRLVLTSSTMGEGTDITLSGDSDLSKGATTLIAPQNAKFTIDGLEMESNSNKVDSAISGVTLELLVGDKAATTITVGANTDTLKISVQSFVSAYNTLMTAINTQTKVTATGDAATTKSGALTGDASMRQLVSSLRNELLNSSGGGLSQMGISTDSKTGLLTLDDKAWTKAVATQSGATNIAKVFTGDAGLISRMIKSTASYVGTAGTLAQRTTDLNNKLTDLTTQQAELDRRIESLQTSLSAKYNAMDTLVAQLNASSSSIMTTLNSLNNPKSS
ncbi:flagellar cap protein FliD [Pseudomonas lundensis]|uniref:Flagellar hook-associated protein 2 n=1 Tax=Pseudomonas lundensis TaxID=86185 RepID=A0A266NDY4_9PSED|nr:flagellar filament capping protein FliD [Pseudomonas lundensis]OZY60704.1 flagellar cap protein FliD [Pseudomonas lundensis]